MKLFVISGEWPQLARVELEVVLSGKKWKKKGLISTCVEANLEHIERLALCKEAYEVNFCGSEEEVRKWCQENPQATTKTVRVGQKGIDGHAVRSILIPWLGQPQVDLEKPEEEYCMIADEDSTWYLCKKIWENKEIWNERKSHNRAAPHPTAMHPKLARAMINLSGAQQEILDPFCGAGGILLEGALMKLKVNGVDIDSVMIERAQKNLEQFNCSGKLIEGDACTWSEKNEAIITDLPYGRNSKAEDLEQLYSEFLEVAKKITKNMVVAFPDSVDVDDLLKKSKWKEEHRFVIPLHKSLGKIICMLHSQTA